MPPARPAQLTVAAHADHDVLALELPAVLPPLAWERVETAALVAFRPRARTVVALDLARCDYAGSVLLGLLVNLLTRCRSAGAQLAVCGMPPALAGVARAARFERLFELYPDVASALDDLA